MTRSALRALLAAVLATSLCTVAQAEPRPARKGPPAEARARHQKRMRKKLHRALTKKLGLDEARARKVEKILGRYLSKQRELRRRSS